MAGKKWQTLVNDALAGVYPALCAMSDAELRNVRSAPKKMSSANCWWLVYECAPILSGIASDLLRARAMERRKLKKSRPNV